MGEMIRFVVHLRPIGKGRPRLAASGRTYTPAGTRRWEAQFAAVADLWRPEAPLAGPVRLQICAVLPRPKRLCRRKDPDGRIWAPKLPDADNVAKAVLDAMAGWWLDDRQVVDLRVRKVYAARGEAARVEVAVGQIEEVEA